MAPALVIVGSLLILTVVIVALPQLTRVLRERGRAALEQRYPAADVRMSEMMALSFGVQSKGAWQGRGNGVLALTDTELCFVRYVLTSELRIPITSIVAVSLVRSHLGKTQHVELLHVRYTLDGVEDAIAWRVPEPRAWKERIDGLRGNRVEDVAQS